MLEVEPVVLTGRFIRLEPLTEDHVHDLSLVGLDDDIWRYMLYGEIRTQEDMHSWVKDMLERQAKGFDLPFAVIFLETGRAIGATRYLDIRQKDHGLEIGGTWYGVQYQRTVVNKEAKLLLLTHAFETLNCIRVQFKTDLRNEQSQRAIERLGAVKEGVLRNHMLLPGGVIRHSVYYSIIKEEWPRVKEAIERKLGYSR
ncbi:MAG: N-acetyltransferase [Chloroflexi bacterium]|nr:MAG: N-acetyltransferase [Chloroflexota bacterium]